jgi:guanine deaminase
MVSEGMLRMSGEVFMRRAIALSREHMEQGSGGPFGAVVVKDSIIIAEGWNRVTSSNDPTAHAEIVAIRAACAALGQFSLQGCEIYTSCEPCPMCLAAIYWARLERIYYANTRADAARIGSDDEFLYREIAAPLEARRLPMIRMLADEARAAFAAWEVKPDKTRY